MDKCFNLFKLNERETRETIAGEAVCGCGCAYASCGGSSTSDNFNANYTSGGGKGLISPHYEPQC